MGDAAWVLVFEAVRSGAGAVYRFSDRGVHELNGVPDARRVFVVERSI